MAENNPKSGAVTRRYLMAIFAVVVFAIILFTIDSVVTYVIINFIPGLSGYIVYAWETSNAVVGVVGTYVIYRILVSVVHLGAERRNDVGGGEVRKLVLRIIFYFAVIAVVLTAFNVNLAAALASAAVGGVILGLAVQTVTTSILSGFLVSTSRTIVTGDIIILKSSYWGGADILLRISKVNTLYTEGVTQNSSTMRLPNPLLLNSTIMTNLKRKDGTYFYPLQTSIDATMSVSSFEIKAKAELAKRFAKLGLPAPEMTFTSKTMQVDNFVVLIPFKDIAHINGLINTVNHVIDDTYWESKKKTKS